MFDWHDLCGFCQDWIWQVCMIFLHGVFVMHWLFGSPRCYLDPEFDLCHYTIHPWTQVWSNFLLSSAILCKLFSKRKKTEQKENVFNLPQTCWLSALQLHVCTLVSDATLLFFLQYVHEYIFIIRQIIALTSEDVNDQNMLQSLA